MAEGMIVQDDDDGQRIDRWLKKHFPDLSFGQLQKILRTGQVRVDGKRCKTSTRLVKGQSVRIPPQVTAPVPGEKKISPRDAALIKSLVIYQDDYIIAINKPAGIATQGGSKIGRNIDDMMEALTVDGVKPRLVHRLDKDTSGVLLLARSLQMAQYLGDMFKGRDIRKYYWGITVPAPQVHQGKIQSAIAKTAGRGGERMMAVDKAEGKNALTYYSVMEHAARKVAWVAFWPRTGRMHQIRVHAAQMGCPLLGDYKYGEQEYLDSMPELPATLHLHARRVIFQHPATGKTLDIVAPLDKDMAKTFEYFNFDPNDTSDPFEELEI